jgi:hypothetical protein
MLCRNINGFAVAELVAQTRAFQRVCGFWPSSTQALRRPCKMPQSQRATLRYGLSIRHFELYPMSIALLLLTSVRKHLTGRGAKLRNLSGE